MAQRYLETFSRRDDATSRIPERWSFLLMTGAYILVMLAALVEWYIRGRIVCWPAAVLGVVMFAGGLVLRRQAIRALGRHWSVHIALQEGHRVVREGPYRWVRHPAYLGMILEVASVPLVANAWIAEVLAWCLYLPTVLLRLGREEKALLEKLGPEYETYRASVPALVPHKRPLEAAAAQQTEPRPAAPSGQGGFDQ